ncbi:mitochondrial fission factor B-like isoform X1, partial [Clarias magur]
MRVPERLQVTQSAVEDPKARAEDVPAAFSMHVPDRLALTDAPDLSPRPHFSQHVLRGQSSSKRNLRQERGDGDATSRGLVQSQLRRSYSDQTFGGTPGRSKHGPLAGHSAGTMPPVPTDSPLPVPPQGLSAVAPVLLSPQSVLQVARKLGKQASNRILQTVTQKYSSRFGFPENPSPQPVEDRADQALKSSTTQEFWRNSEEESGTTVELMVLRRQ